MTATNTSKPAKDGTGSAFTLEMAVESVSTNIAQKAYLGDPSDESLIRPATSVKQPALGTAGTPSSDVITVQGKTAMTPVSVAVAGSFKNYSADNTGDLIKSGAGSIQRIVVNSAGVGATVVLYDGLTAGGPVIGTWSSTAQGSVDVGAAFATGLFAVLASSGTDADVTVIYY